MELPEIRYAWNGDYALAYLLLGDGPVDLVYFQGYLSNVELNWEHPALARFLRELARVSRLIVTDRRNLGCSDRFTAIDAPPIESLVDDLLAVLDAVGSDRPVLFATGDCGFIASLFAAAHPERLTAMILHGTGPTWRMSKETPWGRTIEEIEASTRGVRDRLGDGSWTRRANPSLVTNSREQRWAGRYERLSTAPGAVMPDGMRFAETDVRGVLSSIQVPTLILHRTGDTEEPVDGGRYLASHIRGARLAEVPGSDHFPWAGDQATILREVERFLAAVSEEEAELDRVLATVLFTDIVGSTEKLASLGDHAWRDLVHRHHSMVRSLLARYRGTEIDTAGDGFFATFDGPARAVRCAHAIVDAARPLGVEVRAGLHTGEVETIAQKVGGLAVTIGARVASLAGPSEVLVSQTVKDLVAGSGLAFKDRGLHELKGVPGKWRLAAVTN
jgi:class 3 adenylate cyclase